MAGRLQAARALQVCSALLLVPSMTSTAPAALEGSGLSGALGLFSAALALFGAALARDGKDA